VLAPPLLSGAGGGERRRGGVQPCRQSASPASADGWPRWASAAHQAPPRGRGGNAGVEPRACPSDGGRRSPSAPARLGGPETGAAAGHPPPQRAVRVARPGEAPTRRLPAAAGGPSPVGWRSAAGGPPTPSRPGVGARAGVGPAPWPGGSRTPRVTADGRGGGEANSAATSHPHRDGDHQGLGCGPGVLRRAGLAPRSSSRGAPRRAPHPRGEGEHRRCAGPRQRRQFPPPRQGPCNGLGMAAFSARACAAAGAQPRCGHGRSRRRRRGMVARARPRLMAWWRCVETGVLPAGAALNAAGRLSPPRWSTGCETGLGGGAREETGCAGRTDRAQGRPTTARSRRHERRLEQVVGGKRPTRIEGGLRRLRLTPASALSTVAARRDARKRLPSAPT
jgi:hypothetical protein